MRSISITLGDRSYTIPQAPIGRAKAWRKQLKKPLNEILALISGDLLTTELTSAADVIGLAEKMIPVLMDAPETVLELLLGYAPALKADRSFIEEHGYDEQVVDAFLAVLKVAFPLARLTELLGPMSPATSPSSPAPSGE
jgi:hypothetical protein